MTFLTHAVRPSIFSLTLCLSTAAFGQQSGRLGVLVEESSVGTTIREIIPGSAAAKAGLLPGDVVVAIDSTPISTAAPLTTVVQRMAAGQKVQIKLRRGKEDKTVVVALDRAVAAAAVTPQPADPMRRMQEEMRGSTAGVPQLSRPMLGVALQPIEAAMRERLKLGVQEGMWINSVRPGSAAAEAGLQVDDVLLSIDGKAIPTAEIAAQIVGGAKPGALLTVKVWRNGASIEKKATVRPLTAELFTRPTPDFPPRLFGMETPGSDRLQQLETRVRALELQLQQVEQQLRAIRAANPVSPALTPVPSMKK